MRFLQLCDDIYLLELPCRVIALTDTEWGKSEPVWEYSSALICGVKCQQPVQSVLLLTPGNNQTLVKYYGQWWLVELRNRMKHTLESQCHDWSIVKRTVQTWRLWLGNVESFAIFFMLPAAWSAEHLLVLSFADFHVDVLFKWVEVQQGEGVIPGVGGPVGSRDAHLNLTSIPGRNILYLH